MRLTKYEKEFLVDSINHNVKNLNRVLEYATYYYKNFKDITYLPTITTVKARIKWLMLLKNKLTKKGR